MDVRVFRVQTAGQAQQLTRCLAEQGVDASIAERAGSPYVAVWSDRSDVADLVGAVCPSAVLVNLDHVPLPRRGEGLLAT